MNENLKKSERSGLSIKHLLDSEENFRTNEPLQVIDLF